MLYGCLHELFAINACFKVLGISEVLEKIVCWAYLIFYLFFNFFLVWQLVISSSYRACYGVLRFIMESGAKGCEVCLYLFTLCMFICVDEFLISKFNFLVSSKVIVSGKLRAQRAKSMKFKDGYMISSGQPVNEYIDSAVRHVLLRQVSLIFVMLISVPVIVLER